MPLAAQAGTWTPWPAGCTRTSADVPPSQSARPTHRAAAEHQHRPLPTRPSPGRARSVGSQHSALESADASQPAAVAPVGSPHRNPGRAAGPRKPSRNGPRFRLGFRGTHAQRSHGAGEAVPPAGSAGAKKARSVAAEGSLRHATAVMRRIRGGPQQVVGNLIGSRWPTPALGVPSFPRSRPGGTVSRPVTIHCRSAPRHPRTRTVGRSGAGLGPVQISMVRREWLHHLPFTGVRLPASAHRHP